MLDGRRRRPRPDRQDVLRRGPGLLGGRLGGGRRARRAGRVRRLAGGRRLAVDGRRIRSCSASPERRRRPGRRRVRRAPRPRALGWRAARGRRDAARGRRSAVAGVTSAPSSARTVDSQSASRAVSAASMSDSRRRESSTTSQTSPAPTTSPTMSSHQLNSAFTAAKYRERDRNGPGSVPRLHFAGCSTSPRTRCWSSSARSPSAGTASATPSAWRSPTWSWSGSRGGPANEPRSSPTG